MRKLIAIAASGLLAASMSLPALAQTTSSVSSSGTSASAKPWKKPEAGKDMKNRLRQEIKKASQEVNIACVQAAVAKRETSLSGAFSAFTSSVSTAYATRASALNSAWSLTDASARRMAVKGAWDAFKKSSKSARDTYRGAKKDAWKLFKTESKNCGATTTGDEIGESLDDGI
jgi:3-oxoacyl-(acyl-carrier-protein) synthase